MRLDRFAATSVAALLVSYVGSGCSTEHSPPSAPAITVQPVSQAVFGQGTATFTVAASGTGTLSYQWQKNGVPIAGARSDTYTATPQSPADDGSVFTVVVSDAFEGSTTSSRATLTVMPGFWPTGNMTTSRWGHSATLLPDGKVLVAGGVWLGEFKNTLIPTAEVYDPATGTFSATGSMVTARGGHTATLLPNGKVLLVGRTAELYDPATGTFSATGSMVTARGGHTATLLPNGKVLLVGGFDVGVDVGGFDASVGGISVLLVAELYDPVTGTFLATGSTLEERWKHTATLLPNGRVLVAGGDRLGGNTILGGLSNAELYDPASGTFSATGSMASARGEHAATLLPNGKVLVAGGWGAPLLASAELYDPLAETFSPTGSMVSASSPSAALLQDGRVLVVEWKAAELYDPATGTFSATGSMVKEHEGSTTTLLSDGTVLIAGGAAAVRLDISGSLAIAQLYVP